MTISQRTTKKTIIASVYIIIFITIIFWFVITFFPKQPVIIVEKPDIRPLQIVKSGEITLNNGYSDFWAEISNPNDSFGASQLDYTFVLKDANGQIQSKSDSTFVLPGDKKRYILLLNLDSNYELEKVELSQDPNWVQLSSFQLPELVIRNISLENSSKAGNAFTAFGILTNNSPVNLKNIQVVAILTDDKDNVIGVNRTLVRDVLTSESRDFEMIWQNPIPDASTANTTIYAQSNVLSDRELLIQLQQSPIFDR